MKFVNQAEFVLLTLSSAYTSLRRDGEIMSSIKDLCVLCMPPWSIGISICHQMK